MLTGFPTRRTLVRLDQRRVEFMRCNRALALFVFFLAAMVRPCAWGAEGIKVGVHLALSGERAPVGRIMRNAVELAVEEVNRTGGINRMPLRPIYEDSGSTPDSAATAARRLVHEHEVVAIVGELFSPFVLASRDVVEGAGVPYLTGGTSPRTTESARWIFRVAASDAVLAGLLARFTVEQHQLRRLAVLSSRVGVHNARAELLLKVLQEKHALMPAVRETWSPDDRDFSPMFAKVKAASVEAVIALGETAEAPAFLRQLRAQGISAPVIAHRDFGVKSVLDEAGLAAEDVLIVTEYVPALLDAERQAWARSFQQRWGAEPGIIGAQYHDAILLLAAAMRGAGTTRTQIKAGLEKLREFRGVMGNYTFDAKHDGLHRFYVARIRSGQPTLEAVLDATP
ncbi:MAG: ABC transporter substrate-binding protein [Burkholderiales bacterium]